MDKGARVNPLTGFLAAEAVGDMSAVDRILDAVREHLGMEIAFASRFVDGRREFTNIRADIPLPLAPGDSEPLEETFCQRIIEGRLPELIHNASDHEAARELPLTAALPIGSHLNVPLRLRDGSIYGTFCGLSREPDHSLTQRDLSTLRAFADLASGQIEARIDREREQDRARARIAAVLAGEQMTMFCQPIHSLKDGRAVGVECLARFPADELSRPPNEWFEAAAEVGLGIELELLAVRQALRCLPYIPGGLYMAVNVSPETVLAGALGEAIDRAPSGRLVIEVTEHSQVDDYPALLKALEPLRARARIAIDDVGAGYAGLRHLVDLKPDLMKLDIALIRDVHRDEARHAIAQAMVAFAGRIGSAIVAEGVECAEERDTLAALGIRFAQGYHFSRPMPAVAVQQYLIGANAPPEAISPPSASKWTASR